VRLFMKQSLAVSCEIKSLETSFRRSPDEAPMMREISLVVSVAGNLILVGVPFSLLSGTSKADWGHLFHSWRTWLVIGVLLISLGISLSVLD
jgi:hypothetical protein